jgi:hypothetical protein
MSSEREDLGSPIFSKPSRHRDTHWGSIPATIAGCPISAWFWQMWDTAGLPLKSVAGTPKLSSRPERSVVEGPAVSLAHKCGPCTGTRIGAPSPPQLPGIPYLPGFGRYGIPQISPSSPSRADNSVRVPQQKPFTADPAVCSSGSKPSEVKELPFFSPGTHTHAVGKHLRRRAALAAEGAASCRD